MGILKRTFYTAAKLTLAFGAISVGFRSCADDPFGTAWNSGKFFYRSGKFIYDTGGYIIEGGQFIYDSASQPIKNAWKYADDTRYRSMRPDERDGGVVNICKPPFQEPDSFLDPAVDYANWILSPVSNRNQNYPKTFQFKNCRIPEMKFDCDVHYFTNSDPTFGDHDPIHERQPDGFFTRPYQTAADARVRTYEEKMHRPFCIVAYKNDRGDVYILNSAMRVETVDYEMAFKKPADYAASHPGIAWRKTMKIGYLSSLAR